MWQRLLTSWWTGSREREKGIGEQVNLQRTSTNLLPQFHHLIDYSNFESLDESIHS
jgi:hypothetical protein